MLLLCLAFPAGVLGQSPGQDLTAGLDSTQVAQDVTINDFEVMDTGPRIAETWACVQSIIPPPELFMDGFEDR